MGLRLEGRGLRALGLLGFKGNFRVGRGCRGQCRGPAVTLNEP